MFRQCFFMCRASHSRLCVPLPFFWSYLPRVASIEEDLFETSPFFYRSHNMEAIQVQQVDSRTDTIVTEVVI